MNLIQEDFVPKITNNLKKKHDKRRTKVSHFISTLLLKVVKILIFSFSHQSILINRGCTKETLRNSIK